MPTYVYACSACDSTFEIEQRITESSLEVCELCASKGTIKRVIQPVGIAFKGSGFHINDYSGNKTDGKSESESKSEAGSETKSEAKPEGATTAPAAAASESASTPATTESAPAATPSKDSGA